MVFWWCNPGRWTAIFIYVALIMCILGSIMVSSIILNVNESITASDESRARLQAQIEYLDDFMRSHSHMGRDLPEGGS